MNKLQNLRLEHSVSRSRRHSAANLSALSRREREVLRLAAKGFGNKAIAYELNITEGTVKTHLHRIYQKLGIKSRFALAAALKKPLSAAFQAEDRDRSKK